MEGMGRSSFPITTTSPEAQAFFNQGVAQLHSFWVRESERSFMQAAQLDPDAAMAYWGIAISAAGDYRPAFQLMRNRSRQGQAPAEPDSGRARALEAIKKAMELRSRVSERERLYIEALSARRDPESKDATGEYTRGLRKLVAAYPDDLEAKSILALAIQNGYEPVTREPREGTMDSLALLREILSRDPDHIGAHHYMIHGCEEGKRPQDAWQSCKRYPELVPNIPHALHMPGHIYAQSDRLEDAAHSFASAALTELGYMAADATYGSGHYGHNHHFLIHTLGLQGRYREAMSRTSELLRIKENPRERASVDGQSTHRQGWFCLMKTLVRFEKWDEILDGQTLPLHDKPREAAWYHWARGLAHLFKGNVPEAEASLREMRKSLETLKDGSKSIPPQLDAARVELEGHIEARSGK
jgi:tetratricopeptide (TPR) repeat protein